MYGIALGYPSYTNPGTTATPISPANLALLMQQIKAAGPGKIRIDYNGTAGSTCEAYVNAAVAAGLGVMLIIKPDKSQAPSVFAAAVTTCVNYFKSKVFEYELGNEMNIQGWTNGAQYAPYGKAGGDAVKAAQPGALRLMGAISNFGVPGGSDARIPTNWLASIYSVKATYGTDWFDAVPYHPYGFSRNASGPTMMANPSGWPVMFDSNPSLRSIMVANGDGAKKIYVTEHGSPTWSDGTVTTDWLDANFPGDPNGVTEAAQASQATLTIQDWERRPASIRGDLYFFDFRDRVPQNTFTANREGHFGWQRQDLSSKPAMAAAVAAIAAAASGGGTGGTGTGGTGVTVRSFASVTTLAGTSAVVAAPAGVVDGDIVQLLITVPAGVTVTPPAGFSLLAHVSSHSGDGSQVFSEVYLYGKVAASEPGTYTIGASATGNIGVLSVAVKGAKPELYSDIASVEAGSASATLAAPSVNGPAQGSLLTYAFQGNKTVLTFPASETKQTEVFVDTGNVATSRTISLAQEILGSAGATGNRTVSDTNPNAAALDDRMVAISVAFAPAPVTQAASSVTLTGGVTDAMRASGVSGDGRAAPDSTVEIWRALAQLHPNGSLETDRLEWNVDTGGVQNLGTGWSKFGVNSLDNSLPAGVNGWVTAVGGGKIPVVAGTQYVWSFWILGNAGGEQIQMGIEWYNASNALISAPTGPTVSCTTAVAGQRGVMVATAPAGATGAFVTWKNVGGATARTFIDGAQLEAAPYATPFYPASKGADVLTIPVPPGLTPTKGAIAFRVRPGWASNGVASGLRPLMEWRKDASNDLALWYDLSQTRWEAERRATTASEVDSASQTFAAGSSHLVVFAWDATTLYLSINGGAYVTVANALIPSGMPSLLSALCDSSPAQFDGGVHWVLMMANVPTTGELATLNGLGNTDPTLATLTAALPQLLWTAVDQTLSIATTPTATAESWDAIPI